MQTWFDACTLYTWQVKTIRPVGWSPAEGEEMDVVTDSGLDVGEGIGVKKLKLGVAPISVAGEENPEGVEACSVANRSGVGAAEGVNNPHPRRKKRAAVSHSNLFFFVFQFDRFNVEFLT